MLQRVNFVMMLVVALMVIGVGVQVMITQRYNTLALQAITTDLARMKFEAQTPSTANSTASVLVQGDVRKPGWYPIITRDGATFLKDLVERAEPTEASHSVSIRLPNQELGIVVPDAEIPSRVMQPDAIVNVTNRSRFSKSTSTEKPAATDSQPNAPARAGFVYVDGDVPRPGVYNIPSVGQLTLRRLIAAAGGPKGGGDYGVLISGIENNKNITRFESKRFTQDSDQDPDLLPEDRILITSVASKLDRARADALYDFVKQLMSQVSAEHASDHAYIRGVLDQMEAELPTKYPNNPDLQGLIKEMIAGRRKILEYDERIPAPAPGTAPATSQASTGAGATAEQLAAQQRLLAESERAKSEAIEKFLRSLLASGDPNAPTLSMRELLDKATEKINTDYADNPDMQATLRKAVEDARKNLDASSTAPATQPSP